MPVADQEIVFTYTGNGVATVYPYTCYTILSTHLKVKLDDVLQSSGYTITGLGSQTGGTIVFSVAPANGVDVLIYRELPWDRPTDYQPSGAFNENTVDKDQDYQTMQIQQLAEADDRTFMLPVGADPNIVTEFPLPGAGEFFRYSDDGTRIITDPGIPYTNDTVIVVASNYASLATYFEDSGVADDYVLTNPHGLDIPELIAGQYPEGMYVRCSFANANTGACVISVGGGPEVSIKTMADADPGAGDIPDDGTETHLSFRDAYDGAAGAFIIVATASGGGGGGGGSGTRVESASLTSGTTVEFTGLPAGINEIRIGYANMNVSGAPAELRMQLGHGSTTYITSTYIASSGDTSSGNDNNTAYYVLGKDIKPTAGTQQGDGVFTLYRVKDDVWTIGGTAVRYGGGGNLFVSGGSVNVTADLSALKFVISTGTFVQGRITITHF